ncbi:hypothetical protein Tco_1513123, partial [Tanacetum coccineum]
DGYDAHLGFTILFGIRIQDDFSVNPVCNAMFVEQFWMTAKSKIINNVRYIIATVAGKPVSISEASIRSDLQFNDVAGIDVLPNQAIFDNIQLMGPSSSNLIPDSIPEGSGGNHGGQSSSDRPLSGNEDGLTLQSVYDLCVSLCKQVTTQAAQIKDLKAQIKQLKKKAKLVISHHNACIKSGRKPAKSEPTVLKDPAFNDLDDAMDYMETKDAHDEGTIKDSKETRVSTKDQFSTDKPKVSTDKLKVSTDKPNKVTAEPKDANSDDSAAPTIVFRDDETIA